MAALGGIERFLRRGDDVIVKPNICVAYHTYEYAATTNPWVVGTLVKLCREAGARRIRVMDSPFGGGPEVDSWERAEVRHPDGELVTLQQPHVIRERCNGCGICEYRCPVNGESAIRVYAPGLTGEV